MAEQRRLFPPVWLALLALAGCGGSPPPPPPAADSAAQVPPAPAAASPPQAVNPAAAASPSRPLPAREAAALVPLPTPRQVIAALPLGRRDPFAAPFPPLPPLVNAPPPAAGAAKAPLPPPAAAVAAARPTSRGTAGGPVGSRSVPTPQLALPPRVLAPLQPPDGLRVMGLIHTGGRSEAVVAYGNLTGSLRPGDRGGFTTNLLPGGWSVAAVDVNRGRVILQRGRRRVTAEL